MSIVITILGLCLTWISQTPIDDNLSLSGHHLQSFQLVETVGSSDCPVPLLTVTSAFLQKSKGVTKKDWPIFQTVSKYLTFPYAVKPSYIVITLLTWSLFFLLVCSSKPLSPRLLKIVLAVLIVVLLFNVLEYIATYTIKGDYRAYYVGGMAIREGLSLQDRPELLSFAREHGVPKKFPPLNYPPFWYLCCLIPSYLDLDNFYVLITIINHLLLGAIIYLGLKILNPDRKEYAIYVLLLSNLFLSSLPLRWTMYDGQTNLLITFLLLLFIYLYERGDDSLGGLFLGLAAGIKLFPLVVILPLLTLRRFTIIGISVVTFGTTVLFSALFVGFGEVWRYFVTFYFFIGTGPIEFDMKQSLVSVLARIPQYGLGNTQTFWVTIGTTLSVLLVVAAFVSGFFKKSNPTFHLILWFNLMILCSAHSLFHHFALTTVTFIVLMREVTKRRRFGLALITGISWFLCHLDYKYFLFKSAGFVSYLASNLFFAGLVMLTCITFYLVYTSEKSD